MFNHFLSIYFQLFIYALLFLRFVFLFFFHISLETKNEWIVLCPFVFLNLYSYFFSYFFCEWIKMNKKCFQKKSDKSMVTITSTYHHNKKKKLSPSLKLVLTTNFKRVQEIRFTGVLARSLVGILYICFSPLIILQLVLGHL